MDHQRRAWYVTLIAAYYLVGCSGYSVYYISHCFQPGFIHSPRELLGLGGAAAAWLYFFKPSWGHRGLLALTVATLVSIGNFNDRAFTFHFVVLGLLVLPLCTRRRTNGQTEPQTQAG
jgi:hypothetical protein